MGFIQLSESPSLSAFKETIAPSIDLRELNSAVIVATSTPPSRSSQSPTLRSVG